MTTRNMAAAFVVSMMVAWSQLGGVAHAQHEPVQVEHAEATPSHASSHRPVRLDPELHPVDSVPQSSRGAHVAGGVSLIVLGGLGVGGSLVFAFIGQLQEHPLCLSFSDSRSCPGHDATGWWVATGVSAGLGLVSLVSGIALVASRDPRNTTPPPVRVAVAPTEGGAFGTVAVDF